MHEIVTLTEIIGPTEQGISRPYRCRGEDGAVYYVKGRQTDRHSVWSEWLCGHLAQAFGLPVPPFRLVEILPEILEETPRELRDLGEGLAFGSRQHSAGSWFETGRVGQVDATLQKEVLVFDWWINNLDRLTGNPNLLWDNSLGLVVIDHNRAFDADFDRSFFLKHHVFASVGAAVFGDLVEQQRYADRLAGLLPVFDDACDNAPDEWHWANPEQDVPANFNPAAARTLLTSCITPDFWRRQ